MKRPEVTLQNYQAVYEYYEKRGPNPLLQRAVATLISPLYRPRVHFVDGTDAQLKDSMANDNRLLMACNHLFITDQFPVGVTLRRNPDLKPILGRLFIPGKPTYFKAPYPRPILDGLGAMPVFRQKDMRSPEDANLRLSATKAFLEAAVSKVVRGEHMLIFPQGERNRNGDQMGTLKSGVGRIAFEASKRVPVAVVPMGLSFGEEDQRHWLQPDLVIGRPISSPFESRAQLNSDFAAAFTHCASLALEKSSQR